MKYFLPTLNIIFYLFVMGCSDSTTHQNEIIISSKEKWQGSTTAGNLISTAIRQENDLDIVLYPTAFLADDRISVVKVGMTEDEIDNVLKIYPNDVNDQFLIGSMKGKDIKEFLFLQSESSYRAELQVAGLRYDFSFVGGLNTTNSISRKNRGQLNDDQSYRVAVSNTFFFSGQTAPGYLFGYGFNFSFRRFQRQFVSAKNSLKSYLQTMTELPLIESPRARVKVFHRKKDLGFRPIYEIQGVKHLSPYRGHSVTTRGVITAMGFTDRYPGGHEIYLQDPVGDSNLLTSDALFVFAQELSIDLKVGDSIEVSGIVYEDRFNSGSDISNGLTRTSLRQVTKIKILNKKTRFLQFPVPTVLGQKGRKIPKHFISTYNSNLNNDSKTLNINDGIDFWESLESMRIRVSDPKVVGFSGGKDKLQDKGPKSFLNLYIRPDGRQNDSSETPAGGMIINEKMNDYNPNILSIWTHHLNRGIDAKDVFRVGEVIKGSVDGLLVYEKSFFNDGHYAFLLTEPQKSLSKWKKKRIKIAKKEISNLGDLKGRSLEEAVNKVLTVPFQKRPKTTILPTKNQLTVATYNLENLSNKDTLRMKEIAKSIKENLKCPDILNLVEIQDFNGINLNEGSSASETLKSLIGLIPCTKKEDSVQYQAVNIDPAPNSEGGQPGGNIRVSMLYNSLRVGFQIKPNPNPLAETFIDPRTGELSNNPGRVFPNDPAFRGSRKSLIAEFIFKGERVVVIGNHFNSKLGDASLWGANQPPVFRSIKKRTQMADAINDFVEALQRADSNVNIIVAGDFNAHLTERAMKALEGNDLSNLILFDALVAPNDRYTTNHNGNSQGLDYILANKKLLQKIPRVEVLHVNSDYMGKHSDHDPLVAGFTFR